MTNQTGGTEEGRLAPVIPISSARSKPRPPSIAVRVPIPKRLPSGDQFGRTCREADKVVAVVGGRYDRARSLVSAWKQGYPSTGDTPGHSGVSDPVGTAAARAADGAAGADLAQRLAKDIILFEGLAAALVAVGRRVIDATTTKAAEDADIGGKVVPIPAGQGSCAACRRFVSGSSSDRLRSGYCDACRQAWKRAGYPDRARFEMSRRAEPVEQYADTG